MKSVTLADMRKQWALTLSFILLLTIVMSAWVKQVERVNFHDKTSWHELIIPVGPPEFALLDENNVILYRWVGYTEKQEFAVVLDPLCK